MWEVRGEKKQTWTGPWRHCTSSHNDMYIDIICTHMRMYTHGDMFCILAYTFTNISSWDIWKDAVGRKGITRCWHLPGNPSMNDWNAQNFIETQWNPKVYPLWCHRISLASLTFYSKYTLRFACRGPHELYITVLSLATICYFSDYILALLDTCSDTILATLGNFSDSCVVSDF